MAEHKIITCESWQYFKAQSIPEPRKRQRS